MSERLWICTFGGSHTHPLTGETLSRAFVRVPATSRLAAHDEMFLSIFGRQWAFSYAYADDEDVPPELDGTRSAGVKRFQLREIEWVPPSDVARGLWAQHEQIAPTLTHTEYIDRVVRPAEIAHHTALRTAAAARTASGGAG